MDARPSLAAALLLCLAVLAAAPPTAAQVVATAETTTVLYLTGVGGEAVDGVDDLTLAPTLASTDGQVTFTPLTGGIGLPTNPAGAGDDEASWHTVDGWAEDQELAGDAVVDLWIQGAADVAVELLDVHPDGTLRTLGEDRRSVNQQGQEPQRETFRLPAVDPVMEQGHGLRLRVALDSVTSAAVLHFDADDTPAAVTLQHAPLDTDDDGISDRDERALGTDPLDPGSPDDRVDDADADGLTGAAEREAGTDAEDPDPDGDGWSAGAEVRLGTDPTDAAPAPADADGDGLADAWEETHFGSPDEAEPGADPDDDGLSNLLEQQYGTDPTDADSDDDGSDDGVEVAQGRNPVDAAEFDEPEPRLLELAAGILLFVASSALAVVGLQRRHAL